jgi:ABC-2 type transport system permease protein
MTAQIQAILWAQFRVLRNLLPRTDVGTIAIWLISLIWYGIYAAIAVVLAAFLPQEPLPEIRRFLPVGLLAMLLFWQIFPLMTLSGGWSIELSKLLAYPIREKTLFAVEVLLRLTTAPEMIIILAGLTVGLFRHPDLPWPRALLLLLYLPLNLFLSLAIRGLVRRLLSRQRLKTVLLILFVTLSVLPSLALNTGLGGRIKVIFLAGSRLPGVPWRELSSLVLNPWPFWPFCLVCVSIGLACWWAQAEFARIVHSDQSAFPDSRASGGKGSGGRSWSEVLFRFPSRLFNDPLAALIEKELRILSRSPRFRFIFGMASLFSVAVFFPLAYGRMGSSLAAQNYLPALNIYGLLILGETLLWNTFGFDRGAAQLYFVAPVPLASVLRAKNVVAAFAIALMTLMITVVGSLFRRSYRVEDFAGSILLTSVLTVFFLAFGNFTSVRMPRPMDPNQAMKNQNNGKASALLLLAALLLVMPIGLAIAARWAFDAEWAFFGVLAIDFLCGLAIYQVATENAIERAEHDREKILDLLSQGDNPIES